MPNVPLRRTWSQDESGDIITGWFGQILVMVVVLAVVAHEFLAPLIGSLALEDPAKRVVKAVTDLLEDGRDEDDARERAEQVAARDDVTIVELTIEDGDPINVTVVVSREPETWFIHRWDALLDFATPDTSAERTVSP